MPNLKKLFAILAVMLCVCMAIPSTVYANELTPDSTPESTLSPDDSASGEISADPAATPEVIATLEAIATPEVTASVEPEVTAEASAEPTAEPEATAAADTPAATTDAVRPARAPAAVTSSVMMPGVEFNLAIKKLSGQTTSDHEDTNTAIKAFIVTADAPPEGTATIDLNMLSGGTPLLTWFDSSTGTVYCYAAADNVTLIGDCSFMFHSMQSLQKVDFGPTAVAPSSAKGMFSQCSSLATLDVSKWDTSKVTDMGGMFWSCKGLTTMDVSDWDTSQVTDMNSMFFGCGFDSLNLASWDTGRVTDMSYMFYWADKLTTLYAPSWDAGSVTTMHGMFWGCSKLATLDVSGWNTRKVTDMGYMFSNCSSLATLDLSNWVLSGSPYTDSMFADMSSLHTLKLSPTFAVRSQYGGEYALSFPTPTKTASGAVSVGKWGLGSETAAKSYTASELYDLGKTAGSLMGTWYAQRDITSTINFDANGGSGTMDAQTFPAAGKLNTVKFSRAGYVFTGWNTAADGSGTAYANEAVFQPAGTDVTLYAQWETGVELPEAGYSSNPGYRVLGMAMTMFGLLMCIVMFSKEKEN